MLEFIRHYVPERAITMLPRVRGITEPLRPVDQRCYAWQRAG